MADIPGAARQACCSAADVVRMILEKKLSWVGVQCGVRGYLSVLVKVDEVKAAVRGPDHGGLTIVEVHEALQATRLFRSTDRALRSKMAKQLFLKHPAGLNK